MKLFKLIILTVVVCYIAVPCCFACDTNLFSIIAGDSKETAFIEASTKLAVAAKNLNENARKPEASKKLEELMNNWLEFSNKYVVFPPEWGKNDEKWKEKFSDLARILGEIRKYLGVDYFKAHSEILRFSRRISKLYEKMPRSKEASLLLDLTYAIDELWLFVEKEDAKGVNILAKSLAESNKALREAYFKNHQDKIEDIEYRVSMLIKYSEDTANFANFQIRVLTQKLEDDLTELDNEISSLNASDNKGVTIK